MGCALIVRFSDICEAIYGGGGAAASRRTTGVELDSASLD